MAISSFNSSVPGQSASGSSVTVTTGADSAAQKTGPSLGERLSCIFSFLGSGGYTALTATCKDLGARTCGELGAIMDQFYQSRCQVLLASDTKRHLFKPFGIDCPQGGAASSEQMQAMVGRIECVLASLAAFSKNSPEVRLPKSFPNFPLAPHTAERLVMVLPPEQLQELLAVAYDCTLYTTFAQHAMVDPAVRRYSPSLHHPLPVNSLAAATQNIQRWLPTEAAKWVNGITLGEYTDTSEEGGVACLSVEIGRLSWLSWLCLNNQRVATLPDELGQLSKLNELSLRHNQLKEIPSCIGQLTELQVLRLEGNQLKELPSSVGQLSKLQVLNLEGNQLKEVPSCIGQLSKLQVLNLGCNQLTSFQAEASQLSDLEQLDLNGNQIREVPAWIGQLTKLKFLNMRKNQLTAILPEVWLSPNIERLYLDRNQLETLPAWIGQAEALTWITLSYNPLKSLPNGIERLPRLQELLVDDEQYAHFQAQLKELEARHASRSDCMPRDS